MKTIFLTTIVTSLSVITLNAQVVTSTIPDTYVDAHNCYYGCHTDANVTGAHTLNCDMHQVGRPSTSADLKFYAIAFTVTDIGKKDPYHTFGPCIFFDATPSFASGVRLEHQGTLISGGPDICLPDEAHPDVVIGNDYTSPNQGDMYVGIVYLDKGDVVFSNCAVTNVGNITAPLPTKGALSTPVMLNTPGRIVTSKPHVDMFPEDNTSRFGGKMLCRFFATWSEYDPDSDIDYVMGAVGDITSLVYNVFTITPRWPGDPEGIHPDVGCMKFETPGPNDVAFVAYIDPSTNDLRTSEVYIDTTLFGGPGGLDTVINLPPIDSGIHYLSIDPPRIEAKAFSDVVASEASWEIVAAIDDGSGYKKINTYNDVFAPIYPPTIFSVDPVEQHFSPSVAGVGYGMATNGLTGALGQNAFSVMYYSSYTNNPPVLFPGLISGSTKSGDYYSNYIDIAGGTSPFPTVNHEVNHYTLFQNNAHTSPDEAPSAITSCSNRGDDLLTVWYQGFESSTFNWGLIEYKITGGNTYAFKPVPVRDIEAIPIAYEIFPNPAFNKLYVNGAQDASYTITDMLGRQLASGKIHSSKHSINIEALSTGVYIITLNTADGTKVEKIIKE